MVELIISYVVKHQDRQGHQTIIECCGRFLDWEHFDRFKMLEEQRGWKVVSHKLIKQVTS